VVDSVGAVLWISPAQRLPLPDPARFRVASAVVQTDNGMLWLLEPQKFWPDRQADV
jgi:chemotaxis signal transduction protein